MLCKKYPYIDQPERLFSLWGMLDIVTICPVAFEIYERLKQEFPKDLTECRLEEGKRFIVVEYLAYSGRYEELLDVQAGKDFYIPTAEEVLDYNRNLYLYKESAYQKRREFFKRK